MASPTSHTRNELRAIAHRAMIRRGLQPDFSPQAQAEASRLNQAPAGTGPGIRDLRDLLWASIDNDDSRDLDQLSVAAPGAGGGGARILVAIADVDALIRTGGALDDHARTNTTSVYTAAEIFPMLPEKFSTDLTSLGEGQDRQAIVIDMGVGAGGEVLESSIYRALVRNKAKLAYSGVAAWLEGKGPMPPKIGQVPGLDQNLRLQDRSAQAMKCLRHQHGALALETLQTRAVYEGDILRDLRPDEKNRAKELIEDFMIAANGVTAKFLERKGFPSLRRILRSPERWERIVDLAKRLGGRLPSVPDAGALSAFLADRLKADPERFPDLSLSVVKLLGKGEYVMELPGRKAEGHFGLAVRDYTHSTAPNRRYPDLLTQRLLKAALSGAKSPYAAGDLDALAGHCTLQEDNAAKVERQVAKSAAALLLQSRIGETFEAIVTGIGDKGTWVRLLKPPAEGKLVTGFQGLDVGDRTRVKLVRTDIEQGYIDFSR